VEAAAVRIMITGLPRERGEHPQTVILIIPVEMERME
jgi:hypothetical protein